MTANAILKTKKSDISWIKLAKGAYKMSFPTNLCIADRYNRIIFIIVNIIGIVLIFKIQDGRLRQIESH